jgi:hypothetical protein
MHIDVRACLTVCVHVCIDYVIVADNPWDTDTSGAPNNYRGRVVHAIPQLQSLNGVPVTSLEREKAVKKLARQSRSKSTAAVKWEVLQSQGSLNQLFAPQMEAQQRKEVVHCARWVANGEKRAIFWMCCVMLTLTISAHLCAVIRSSPSANSPSSSRAGKQLALVLMNTCRRNIVESTWSLSVWLHVLTSL